MCIFKCINEILKIEPAFRHGHNIGALVLCICLKSSDNTGYDRQYRNKGKEYQ